METQVQPEKDSPADLGPHRVRLTGGRRYRWCACGLSKRQPYCDESHRGTAMDALAFQQSEDITVALCGCKRTQAPPYCDGAHKTSTPT